MIASHSGLRHFAPGFDRNLPDDLALAIARTGGVIQIAFGTPFVDAKAAADTVDYFQALDRIEDESGVALAAIQGLNQKVESENAALRAELRGKDDWIQSLEARLAALESLFAARAEARR